MNGRLYDPMLHRFLMPDNFVQDPYSSLSYNRYSYALNNPLMYFDPSGELTEDNGGSNWLVGLSILAASFIGNSYEDISSWVDGWWPDARNWIGKQAKSVGDAIARPFRETGRWFRNLFKGGRDRPAPEVYMASMPMNAGSGGPNNLPIFGTSSAGSLGIPGGDLLRTGADFVPFVGSGLDIYEGIRDGDGWQVAMGAGFLVLDVATLGSSSLVKGAVKTGVKAGGRSLAKGAAKSGASKLPTQIHHFATNKSKTFTPQMSQIADEFGLSLNGAWNKQALPHLGRHPNAYHNFVLDGMQKARAGAGGSQAEFLNLLNQYVKQPVIQNPGLLRKSGW